MNIIDRARELLRRMTDRPPTVREIERALRKAGVSRKEAMRMVALIKRERGG
jgi:hypothetical protein